MLRVVPLHIVGDPAYPLRSWLMKAYSDGTATPKQKIFNTKLSLTRMVIERSFGKLKGRWGILLKHCDAHLRNMIQIIQT